MKSKVYVACLVFQFLALYEPAAYCQDTEIIQHDVAGLEQKYRKALLLYKQNKPDDALAILDKLRRTAPNDTRYLYDYLAIANGSGHHDLVIATRGLNLNVAPAYVLEALADSQRQTNDYESSLITYDLDIKRFPERVDAQVARVNTLIDAQHYKEAELQLSVLQKKYPGRLDVMECEVRLSDGANQPINTLVGTEKTLAVSPDNSFALRMRFYALKKLGAAHLAIQLTPKSILSDSEQIEAERDRIAFELRWARINAGRTEQASRWNEMDATITKLDEMCKLAESGGDVAEAARGGCGDLVEALSDRRRMPEAIALYEHMKARRWAVQPYVQVAAAAAYLDERQPEQASILFASALTKDPNNSDGRIGYVYALLDSEHYKEADQQIDQMAADTNEWINPKFPAIREPNPDYLQAQLIRAQIRSYTNRLAEAEQRLQLLAARAPNNTEIRQSLASTHNSRGWPRMAENELDWLQAAQPDNVWIKLGLYESRMAVGDFRNAELQLNDATKLAPDEKSVRKSLRDWQTHNLRELVVESTIGKGAGNNTTPYGSQEAVFDARLYSSPLRYDWRIFLHTQYARSTFPTVSVNRETVGGGMEYQIRDFSATGEIRNTGNGGTGLALGADYHIGDHWFFDGLAENKSLSAPVRAYADGVSASNFQIGGGYRWHESRNISLNINRMSFTDGNQRRAIDAFWTEGLLAGAIYTLDSTVEYYASRNSTPATPTSYFNPVSDRQIGITLRNEWLQFHRYEKSLKHVLTIGTGEYAQKDFSSGSVMNIKYEQFYSPGDRLELHYGIGRTLHPYDGVRDSENSITFAADWRF